LGHHGGEVRLGSDTLIADVSDQGGEEVLLGSDTPIADASDDCDDGDVGCPAAAADIAAEPEDPGDSSASVSSGSSDSSDSDSDSTGSDRAPRESRSIRWGVLGWTIAPIFRRSDGGLSHQIGWGAVCGCHNDPTDAIRTQCKKQLVFGDSMHPDEAKVRIKQWLLEGLLLGSDLPEGEELLKPRTEHLKVNPRTLRLLSERTVDRMAP
jgi:hypothetical protein